MTSTAAEVRTRCGRLLGVRRDGVRAFLGIPYAAPPIGPLRLRRPRPPSPWLGARQATSFGAVAPQLSVTAPIRLLAERIGAGIDEDCLYLNVWAPDDGEKKRPVMVWLHGGGFFLGAGSRFLYSGGPLVRRGTVVVTLNYRLGALGFLDLRSLGRDPDAPANLGLHDQIAALEWVRDNIASFGGDPANVTLFGESAGAMSAAILLAVAPPLFRRVILQSGAAANVSTREQAAEVAERFLAEVGVAADESERLRDLPLREILAGQRALIRQADRLRRLPWQPSIDRDLLAADPLDAIAAGAGSEVDLVVGTTRDEWRLFTAGVPWLRFMRWADLEKRIAESLAHLGLGADNAAPLADAYRRLDRRPRPRPHDVWTAFRTDQIFRLPAIDLADRKARHGGRTFMYRFDFELPLLRRSLGACHGADLPLVFGSLDHWALRPFYLGRPGARRLANVIQEAWVGFAREGLPRASGLPPWEPYEVSSRATMIFADPAQLAHRPDRENLALWQKLRGSDPRTLSSGSGPAARPRLPS